MAIAIVLIIIVIASVAFDALTPWWSTPIASNWGTMDTTLTITLVITGIFFIIITLFMAYAIIKFRYREGAGQRAKYEPENKKLEWRLMIITSVAICGMLAPGLVVYSDFVNVPKEAAVFEAVGQQWMWNFRFPGNDGVLGKTAIPLVSYENPLGLDPMDPDGQDDILILSNEIHLPIDQPFKVVLRSKDVLHDFYVPQFRAKMDMVPGQVSYFWFTPTKIGEYEILCAEYCGTGHYNMRGKVIVESDEQFRLWLLAQPTFAKTLTEGSANGLVDQGKRLSQTCFACHSIDGSKSLGPSWKGLYGKTEALADGSSVIVDDDYIRESILKPKEKVVQGYPPVMAAYDFSEEQLEAIIAYTKSLGEQ
jgi:cytochrome c oxidase subunit 2